MRPIVNTLAVAAVFYACELKTLGGVTVLLAQCWLAGVLLGRLAVRVLAWLDRDLVND